MILEETSRSLWKYLVSQRPRGIISLGSSVVSEFSVVLSVNDTSVLEGTSITIEGSAVGGPSIDSYVWRRNGAIVSTESQLAITNMSASDIGEYELTITSAENVSFSAAINIGLTRECASFFIAVDDVVFLDF